MDLHTSEEGAVERDERSEAPSLPAVRVSRDFWKKEAKTRRLMTKTISQQANNSARCIF